MLNRRSLAFALMMTATGAAMPGPARGTRWRSVDVVSALPQDALGRSLAAMLARELQATRGVAARVVARPGEGGRQAVRQVLGAAADGRTVLLASTETLLLSPFIVPAQASDPVDDLAGLTGVAEQPLAIAAGVTTGAQTLGDLTRWWAQHPDQLVYGAAVSGGLAHLTGVALGRTKRLALRVIPLGDRDAVARRLIGGELPAAIAPVADLAEGHRYGLLRLVAVTGRSRRPDLMDVPTFGEAGVEGLDWSPWFGVFVPRATPELIRGQLSEGFAAAVASLAKSGHLARIGLTGPSEDAAAFAGRVAEDRRRIAAILRLPEVR